MFTVLIAKTDIKTEDIDKIQSSPVQWFCQLSFGLCILTGERTGILASAEDDIIDGEEDDDDLDASVETDEGIVADDTEPPATGAGEAVSESDAEKVFSRYLSVPYFRHYIEDVFLFITTSRMGLLAINQHMAVFVQVLLHWFYEQA